MLRSVARLVRVLAVIVACGSLSACVVGPPYDSSYSAEVYTTPAYSAEVYTTPAYSNYYGPGSGTGYGRYYAPGGGYYGPGSGTGLGRFWR